MGDQNQDGYDDILVYSYGFERWELFYGGNPMDTLPDWTIHGLKIGDINIGDLNQDGLADMAIVNRYRNEQGESAIAHNVYFGGDLDTIPDLILDGVSIPYRTGDINGDGHDDVCTVWSGWNQSRGKIRFFLSEDGFLDSIPDFDIDGAQPYTGLGSIFYSGCDINGDGFTDFMYYGYENEDDNRNIYIHFGGERLNAEPDIQFVSGIEVGEYILDHIYIIDDLNGDGIDDFILRLERDLRSGIMFGSDEFELVIDVVLHPEGSGSTYYGLTIGDINGDEYNDLLCSDQTGVGGLGKINLFLGGRWMDGG